MSGYGSATPPSGQEQPQVICPHCRGGNSPQDTICRWCGQPLPEHGSAQTYTPSPSQPGQAPSPYANPYGQPPQPAPNQQSQPGQPSQPGQYPQNPYAYQPGPAQQFQNPYGPAAPSVLPQTRTGRGCAPKVGIAVALGFMGVACLVFLALVFGIVNTATQPISDKGDAFMTALRDANYDSAFALCTADLQQEVGDAQGLEAALSTHKPATWSFNSKQVNNDSGTLKGSVTYSGGDTGNVEIVLDKVGSEWLVSGVNLK